MKRIENLSRVTRYLISFRTDRYPDIVPVPAIEASDATVKLARLSGDQVLVAYPELAQKGGSDSYSDTVSGAFFVLAKNTPAGQTSQSESDTFLRLADMVSAILDRLAADTSGSCDLLSGLALSSVTVTPESSLFGGWTGYSVEFILK